MHEYQRPRALSSSPTFTEPVPVGKTSAVEKASAISLSGTHARLGTKLQVVRKKARRPPNIGGDRGAKDCPFGRATSLPSVDGTFLERNRHDPDRRRFRSRSPCRALQEDLAASNVAASLYWRIWSREASCDEAQAESEAPLGTLSTHSADDDDRDIDVSKVHGPTGLPLVLVSLGPEEQLCYLSR